jgi:hypothetical protein
VISSKHPSGYRPSARNGTHRNPDIHGQTNCVVHADRRLSCPLRPASHSGRRVRCKGCFPPGREPPRSLRRQVAAIITTSRRLPDQHDFDQRVIIQFHLFVAANDNAKNPQGGQTPEMPQLPLAKGKFFPETYRLLKTPVANAMLPKTHVRKKPPKRTTSPTRLPVNTECLPPSHESRSRTRTLPQSKPAKLQLNVKHTSLFPMPLFVIMTP